MLFCIFAFFSYELSFQLDAIGYRFLAGHRISISVSPSYWPAVWTPRKPTTIEISSGRLTIPILDLESENSKPDISKTPVFGPALKTKTFKDPFFKRYLEYG